MKRNLSFFVMLVVCLVATCLLPVGCKLFDKNSGGPDAAILSGLPEFTPTVGTAQSVSFQVVLPAGLAASSQAKATPNQGVIGGIRASIATSTPMVTFKLVLVNIGDTANPTFTMVKTVAANASGTAMATFESVPALTCLGDISIEGGSIGSYTRFHGATDLLAGQHNNIGVSPVDSRLSVDLVAGALSKVIASPDLLLKAGPGLAGHLNMALAEVDPLAPGVYDNLVTLWLAALDRMPTFAGATSSMRIEAPASALPTTVTLTTLLGETKTPGAGGDVVVPGGETAPLILALDESDIPFLLGFSSASPLATMRARTSLRGSVIGPVMNAESTARVLVSMCPLLAGGSASSRQSLLQEIFISPEFAVLVDEIQSQLEAGHRDYLRADGPGDVIGKSVLAVVPVLQRRKSASVRAAIRGSSTAAAPELATSTPGILSFSNDSSIFYEVESPDAVFKNNTLRYKWWFLPGKSGLINLNFWDFSFISQPSVTVIPVLPGKTQIEVSNSHLLNGLQAIGMTLKLFGTETLGNAFIFDNSDISIAQRLCVHTESFAEIFEKMSDESNTLGAYVVFLEESEDLTLEVADVIIRDKMKFGVATNLTKNFVKIAMTLTKEAAKKAQFVIEAAEFLNESLPFIKNWVNAPAGYIADIGDDPPPPPVVVPQAPKVSMVSPRDGTEGVQGSDIRLEASVTPDPGRTIIKVEFFDTNIKRGEVSAAPYVVNLLCMAPGIHQFKAVATDDQGKVGEAEVVTVTVPGIPHGHVLGEFNGVKIRSNGTTRYNDDRLKVGVTPHQNRWQYNEYAGKKTGLKWESVEFVNRYYLARYDKDIRGSGGDAASYYTKAADHSLETVPNDGSSRPRVGDILVSAATSPGHVAIVAKVTDSYVQVVHQNWSNTGRDADGEGPNGKRLYFEGKKVGDFSAAYPVTGWARLIVPPVILTAPTGVSATAGDSKVTLAWASDSAATSYNVYWSTSPEVTKDSFKLASRPNPALIANLANGTTYYFVVSSLNDNGESPLSSVVSAKPVGLVFTDYPLGESITEANQSTQIILTGLTWDFDTTVGLTDKATGEIIHFVKSATLSYPNRQCIVLGASKINLRQIASFSALPFSIQPPAGSRVEVWDPDTRTSLVATTTTGGIGTSIDLEKTITGVNQNLQVIMTGVSESFDTGVTLIDTRTREEVALVKSAALSHPNFRRLLLGVSDSRLRTFESFSALTFTTAPPAGAHIEVVDPDSGQRLAEVDIPGGSGSVLDIGITLTDTNQNMQIIITNVAESFTTTTTLIDDRTGETVSMSPSVALSFPNFERLVLGTTDLSFRVFRSFSELVFSSPLPSGAKVELFDSDRGVVLRTVNMP